MRVLRRRFIPVLIHCFVLLWALDQSPGIRVWASLDSYATRAGHSTHIGSEHQSVSHERALLQNQNFNNTSTVLISTAISSDNVTTSSVNSTNFTSPSTGIFPAANTLSASPETSLGQSAPGMSTATTSDAQSTPSNGDSKNHRNKKKDREKEGTAQSSTEAVAQGVITAVVEGCPAALKQPPQAFNNQEALKSCPMVVANMLQGALSASSSACSTVMIQNNRAMSMFGWQLVWRQQMMGPPAVAMGSPYTTSQIPTSLVASVKGAELLAGAGRGAPYRVVNSQEAANIAEAGGRTNFTLALTVDTDIQEQQQQGNLDWRGVFINGQYCSKIPARSLLLQDCDEVGSNNLTVVQAGEGIKCVSIFCCGDFEDPFSMTGTPPPIAPGFVVPAVPGVTSASGRSGDAASATAGSSGVTTTGEGGGGGGSFLGSLGNPGEVGNTIQQLASSILTLLTPPGAAATTPGSSNPGSDRNTTITLITSNTTLDGSSSSDPGSSTVVTGGKSGSSTTALVVVDGSSSHTASPPQQQGEDSSGSSNSSGGVSLVAVIVPSVAGSLLLAGILAAFWASRLRKDILRHVSRDQQSIQEDLDEVLGPKKDDVNMTDTEQGDVPPPPPDDSDDQYYNTDHNHHHHGDGCGDDLRGPPPCDTQCGNGSVHSVRRQSTTSQPAGAGVVVMHHQHHAHHARVNGGYVAHHPGASLHSCVSSPSDFSRAVQGDEVIVVNVANHNSGLNRSVSVPPDTAHKVRDSSYSSSNSNTMRSKRPGVLGGVSMSESSSPQQTGGSWRVPPHHPSSYPHGATNSTTITSQVSMDSSKQYGHHGAGSAMTARSSHAGSSSTMSSLPTTSGVTWGSVRHVQHHSQHAQQAGPGSAYSSVARTPSRMQAGASSGKAQHGTKHAQMEQVETSAQGPSAAAPKYSSPSAVGHNAGLPRSGDTNLRNAGHDVAQHAQQVSMPAKHAYVTDGAASADKAAGAWTRQGVAGPFQGMPLSSLILAAQAGPLHGALPTTHAHDPHGDLMMLQEHLLALPSDAVHVMHDTRSMHRSLQQSVVTDGIGEEPRIRKELKYHSQPDLHSDDAVKQAALIHAACSPSDLKHLKVTRSHSGGGDLSPPKSRANSGAENESGACTLQHPSALMHTYPPMRSATSSPASSPTTPRPATLPATTIRKLLIDNARSSPSLTLPAAEPGCVLESAALIDGNSQHASCTEQPNSSKGDGHRSVQGQQQQQQQQAGQVSLDLQPVRDGFEDIINLSSRPEETQIEATQPRLPGASQDVPSGRPMQPLRPSAPSNTAAASGTSGRWTAINFSRDILLHRKLGSGAFGTVYSAVWKDAPPAVHVRLSLAGDQEEEEAHVHAADLAVAIKVVPLMVDSTSYNARSLDSLKQEIQLLSRLDHPHVVRFLAACLAPPNVCIVEQLATGGSLHSALHTPPNTPSSDATSAAGAAATTSGLKYGGSGRLLLSEVVRLGAEIASAMSYLHSLKVVHRDLKSANVLLDDQGHALVADFGIAKMRGRTFLSTRNVHAGTPAYMAPEQFEGRPVTERVDQFAFGVMLWEMLTCQLPWADLDHPMQIIFVVGVQGERLALPDDCPPDLATLIRSCWADNASSRPAFADLEAQLRSMLVTMTF